jgi:(4-(4-[2-(gamma-L-glutamylamino)ethyl]phenoxymethyl)furan-2-yl)methanamine synthase
VLVTILALDIGGANTKAALLKSEFGAVSEIQASSVYFPIWKNPDKVSTMISELADRICVLKSLDAIGVTMTAELSDAYQTKREGVNKILTAVARVFPKTTIHVLDADGNLRSLEEAMGHPLKVAAANWVATGWLVSQYISNCIVIDVGSTSTSIIPIVDGSISAAGQTDLEKLVKGELIYTGSLRTNVASIVNSVPVKLGWARVSSELFATTGDVHLVLGHIKNKDFTAETADGRTNKKSKSLARLARIVCADRETLSESEIIHIANYIYQKQIEQISSGLKQVYALAKQRKNTEFTAITTGLGRDFLAKKAAESLGLTKIVDFNKIFPNDFAQVSTAVSLAIMTASFVNGRIAQWKL